MKARSVLAVFGLLVALAFTNAQDEFKQPELEPELQPEEDVEGEMKERYAWYSGCTKCQNSGFAAPPGGCNSQECVIYDLTSQSRCIEIAEKATGVANWKAGLSLTVDTQLLTGKIAAYQILWFNGQWSGWYVPGVNDLDIKLNGCGMRRMWSYFFDHTHKYIVCVK